MKIRTITKNDTLAWSQMRTALWPDTEDGHLSEIEEFFSGQSIDVEQVFMAEVEASPVAFIELNIRNFAEGSRQSQVPYVEGWYVKPAFQSQGIGTALMKRAEEWALSRGFKELASDTEIHNHKSIAFHQYLGFEETERVVCFLKSLET